MIPTVPPSRPSYSKGYIPDLLEHWVQKTGRDLLTLFKPRAAVRVPKSYSLEAFEAPIQDQGPTSSCVGHGTSQGLYTSFAAQGNPLGFVPSPLAIYQLARIMGFSAPTTPLQDTGAQPFFLVQGINQYGIRAMGPLSSDGRNSDVTSANVNTKPLLSQLEEEGLNIVTGEYRVDPGDSTMIEQICTCITQGIAVGFGFQVDDTFENWIPTRGPMNTYDLKTYRGGHWVCFTSFDGFDPLAPEKTVLRGPNQWNRSWGSNGHFEVTGNWAKQTLIDIYPFVAQKVVA